MRVYADNAATTAMSQVAIDAMLPYFNKVYGNPSSLHSVGQEAKEALEQFNMIVTDGDFFTIAGWEEYQNIEGMDKIREQNRLRKQRQRENQKLLESASRDCHVTVT